MGTAEIRTSDLSAWGGGLCSFATTAAPLLVVFTLCLAVGLVNGFGRCRVCFMIPNTAQAVTVAGHFILDILYLLSMYSASKFGGTHDCLVSTRL